MKEKDFMKKIAEDMISKDEIRQAAVEQAQADRKKKGWKRGLTAVGSLAAAFVLTLNLSATFALAVEDVPVLGPIARVLTFRTYEMQTEGSHTDVTIPKVEIPDDEALAQRVNGEIQTRMDELREKAQADAEEFRQNYLAMGNQTAPTFDIVFDYEVKCANERYLSFVIHQRETSQVTDFSNDFFYSIDLSSGQDITLESWLGEDYMAQLDEQIGGQMKELGQQEPNLLTYYESMFSSDPSNYQWFYLNEDENLVIFMPEGFVAPAERGSMEFVIHRG